MSENRIHIFTGAYGSGKTEVSMNYAVDLRKEYPKVALIDLDIVNPYFRSREAVGPLEDEGVDVIFPRGQLATADLPAITPDIMRVLQDPEFQVVFDVGGDEVGATALGRFNTFFKDNSYEMNFVVNTLRPFTKDFAGIQEKIQEVMKTSRLKVTHLVANINLVSETTPENILEGYPIIKEVSEQLGLPLKYLAVEESLHEEINLAKVCAQIKEPIRYIHLFNRPEWLKKRR